MILLGLIVAVEKALAERVVKNPFVAVRVLIPALVKAATFDVIVPIGVL